MLDAAHPDSDFDLAPGKRVCPEKVAVKLSQNEIVKSSVSASGLPLSR
jgi:hypothetical protein